MLTITTRPYSAVEKQQLIKYLPSRFKRLEDFTMKVVFLEFAFLAPVLIIDKYWPVSSKAQAIVSLLLTALAVGCAYWITRTYEGGLRNSRQQAAINAGQAEVLHVTANRAVKREDPEDFGVAFYFEVTLNGQSKLLYLQGQYLDLLEYDEVFPNTEFKIIREAASKEMVDILVLGQPFAPERTLPAFTKAQWQSEQAPTNGDILNGTLAELA
ncbi:MAG: hypothetical protein EOO59_03790 [Hymenobacter sp.]|nr:MAG: hypothetical protein EOO59_03790 [Hymenobacter sp.]